MVGMRGNAGITAERGDKHIGRSTSVRSALCQLRLPAETAGVFRKVTHTCMRISRAEYFDAACSMHTAVFDHARWSFSQPCRAVHGMMLRVYHVERPFQTAAQDACPSAHCATCGTGPWASCILCMRSTRIKSRFASQYMFARFPAKGVEMPPCFWSVQGKYSQPGNC